MPVLAGYLLSIMRLKKLWQLERRDVNAHGIVHRRIGWTPASSAFAIVDDGHRALFSGRADRPETFRRLASLFAFR